LPASDQRFIWFAAAFPVFFISAPIARQRLIFQRLDRVG
jgi:hypothetical protein